MATVIAITVLLLCFALFVCPASMIAVIVLSWILWGEFGLITSVIASVVLLVLFAVLFVILDKVI